MQLFGVNINIYLIVNLPCGCSIVGEVLFEGTFISVSFSVQDEVITCDIIVCIYLFDIIMCI